jgi:mono/diheme cytochrome c family protein
MRRALLAAVAVAVAAAAAAGCGSDDQPERTTAASGAAADPGLTVWAAQGCGTCHTFEAGGSHGTIGPNLDESLDDKPGDYIREGIIAPTAATAPGFPTGLMPEDYAKRIEPAELDALVAWLER